MRILLALSLLSLPAHAVTEAELAVCEKSSDCIVVPYRHCCGSSKRAINKKHKALYESTPAWRKFDDPSKCALMGACPPDKHMTEAECLAKRCELKAPEEK